MRTNNTHSTNNNNNNMIKRSKHYRVRRPYNNNESNVELPDSEERLDFRPPRNRVSLQQNIDRYLNQAREAMSSGDRVLAENYLQHADHFTRLLNEQTVQQKPQQPQPQQRQHDIINELPQPRTDSEAKNEAQPKVQQEVQGAPQQSSPQPRFQQKPRRDHHQKTEFQPKDESQVAKKVETPIVENKVVEALINEGPKISEKAQGIKVKQEVSAHETEEQPTTINPETTKRVRRVKPKEE